jgi:hypothetical protein
MYYEYDHGLAAKERHAELMREADAWRRSSKHRAALGQGGDWANALRVWLGKQLIGWGRQLSGAS